MTSNDLPSIFDACTPRQDILEGNFEAGLAADLARVAQGDANPEYVNPTKFFAGTYPTKGIKVLLRHVLERLGGKNSSAIFWLDTSFGGGKTHALIALLHATQSPRPDIMSKFVDTALLPRASVKLAVFDGNNADISSGHDIGEGIRARTPWGEIAYRLGGKRGYNRVNDSESASAPGADTVRDLLGDGPVLILLDELAVYLRKAKQHAGAAAQFTAFLTSLIKAVEEVPNAALIFTLAMGENKSRTGTDAYTAENHHLAELKSVASRKATILNPTEEGETVKVLTQRLFARCDKAAARKVVDAYKKVWTQNHNRLPEVANHIRTAEFVSSYPLHPEILRTLISKTSTLENFQRIRGMLRLLGHVVHELWTHYDNTSRPLAIHLHHFDMGKEKIRSEITTKSRQDSLVSAIDTDVACDAKNKTSLAQRLDQKHYLNMVPFTTYVARTILMHSLASLKQLKGIDDKNLRYSILSPGMEIGYIDEALARFKTESLYLDDDPQKPTQFQETPNLNKTIQQVEQNLENGDITDEIDRRITKMLKGEAFNVHLFPSGQEDVDDSVEKPKLIVPKYTDVYTSNPESPPDMVTNIFRHRGIGGFRVNRNNLVFLVAYETGIDLMYSTAHAYLARSTLSEPSSIFDLAEHQKAEIKKQKKTLDKKLDDVILECYKYVHYPHRDGKLAHIVMNWKGNDGQSQIVESLHNIDKIRKKGDNLDNPKSLVDRIDDLNNKGKITTRKFREEFYRDPKLPLLIGDNVFLKGIKQGIDDGIFVYEKGDLIRGQDDADCTITIDNDSTIYTVEKATQLDKWPHEKTKPTGQTGDNSSTSLLPSISSITTKGKPSEAIYEILAKLRERKISKIVKIQIRSRDCVFPLLISIGRVREAVTYMKIYGDYRTNTDGIFRFEYEGKLDSAGEEKQFLENRLRNTDVPNIMVELNLDFGEGIVVDLLATLAERLQQIENPIEISNLVGYDQ